MKGIIIKDILIFKQQSKVYAVILGVWLILSFMEKNSMFIIAMLSMFSVFISISLIAYDEKAKWDKYALTMPLSRADMIISKYIFSIGTALIANIFGFVVGYIISKDLKESFILLMLFISVSLLAISIILPLIVKFGTEKGRMLIFAIVFIPTFIVAASEKLGFELPAIKSMTTFSIIAIAFVLLLTFISVQISIKIYNKKEL